MQLWGPEAGRIPEHETITKPSNLDVTIPKGLAGWILLSSLWQNVVGSERGNMPAG